MFYHACRLVCQERNLHVAHFKVFLFQIVHAVVDLYGMAQVVSISSPSSGMLSLGAYFIYVVHHSTFLENPYLPLP